MQSQYTIAVILIVLGILLIVLRTPASRIVLPLIVGVWAIVYGIMGLMDAIRVKSFGSIWRPMTIMALIALALGIIILVAMAAGGNALGSLLGISMIIFSIASIVQWFLTYSAKKNNYLN